MEIKATMAQHFLAFCCRLLALLYSTLLLLRRFSIRHGHITSDSPYRSHCIILVEPKIGNKMPENAVQLMQLIKERKTFVVIFQKENSKSP